MTRKTPAPSTVLLGAMTVALLIGGIFMGPRQEPVHGSAQQQPAASTPGVTTAPAGGMAALQTGGSGALSCPYLAAQSGAKAKTSTPAPKGKKVASGKESCPFESAGGAKGTRAAAASTKVSGEACPYLASNAGPQKPTGSDAATLSLLARVGASGKAGASTCPDMAGSACAMSDKR